MAYRFCGRTSRKLTGTVCHQAPKTECAYPNIHLRELETPKSLLPQDDSVLALWLISGSRICRIATDQISVDFYLPSDSSFSSESSDTPKSDDHPQDSHSQKPFGDNQQVSPHCIQFPLAVAWEESAKDSSSRSS
jgi:hypothetical protein